MSACSTVEKHHANYLSSTAQLQPEPGDSRAQVWRSPDDVRQFSSVKVARMDYVSTDPGISEEEKRALLDRLQDSLGKKFAEWPTNGRGSGRHLEIRGAVTAVDKANVPVNVLAEAVLNFPVEMGGVAVELEAISRPDGKRVAAGRYVIPGRPWQVFRSLTQLGQARHGLDVASDKFFALVSGTKPATTPTTKPPLMVASR
jgi:hypothetical protein